MKISKLLRAKLWTAVLCSLFLCSTVLFFSPLEVFIGNVQEFVFPFANVWWIQLLTALAASAVLTLAVAFLPKMASFLLSGVMFALGLGCYAQALLMNGAMVSLTGDEMEITQTGTLMNLAIWVLILLAVVMFLLVMARKKKLRVATLVLRYLSAVLTGVQAVALAALVFTADLSGSGVETFLLADGQYELSPAKNTVVFLLDTCDDDYVEETLSTWPEVRDILAGFTYYPNATSTYSRTYPALTYLLTGEDCRFDQPVAAWVDQAFTNGRLLPDMNRAGVDVRVYTSDLALIGSAANDMIGNSTAYQYSRVENLSLPGLWEGMLKLALYRDMPYMFKEAFAYDGADINECAMNMEEVYYSEYDCDFYDELVAQSITLNEEYDAAFRFYHLFGCHPGAYWDEEMNYADSSEITRPQQLRGSFVMIEEYIQQLKLQGIFDQTTIIITADHGYSGGGDSLDLPQAARPVLMIKPAGADGAQPMAVSQAPVCHEDLFATMAASLGIDTAGYGRAVEDIAEDEVRERYYYYSALYSDEDGEVALREYRIDGDAADFANWQPTGQWWNIDYSFNRVSPTRFMPEQADET